MYIGKYFHSIDNKNRIFIPSKLRENNKKFIITTGLDKCIYLFDKIRWQTVIQKLDLLNLSDKTQERAFKRAFLSSAYDADIDKNGRILIPQNLKEYASIKSRAVIIGVGNKIEIWDETFWNKYSDGNIVSVFRDVSAKLEL